MKKDNKKDSDNEEAPNGKIVPQSGHKPSKAFTKALEAVADMKKKPKK